MSESTMPMLELFVKADSAHKEGIPCVHSQLWKMIFHVLQQKGLIEYTVTPVHFDDIPQSYDDLHASRVVPVAWVKSGEIAGKDVSCLKIMSIGALETLLQQLECDNLNPSLKEKNVRSVEKVFEDIYKQLMNYIRNDIKKGLIDRLTKLDAHLSSHSEAFLLGDSISYVDCQLMPKLQFIRVAGRAYKDFDIPYELIHLWKYIINMYETPSFQATCPPDRDILMYLGTRDALPKHIRPVVLGSARLTEIPHSAFSDVYLNIR